ncbi:hypothetical protein YC2023_033465 [Brassica napus]
MGIFESMIRTSTKLTNSYYFSRSGWGSMALHFLGLFVNFPCRKKKSAKNTVLNLIQRERSSSLKDQRKITRRISVKKTANSQKCLVMNYDWIDGYSKVLRQP